MNPASNQIGIVNAQGQEIPLFLGWNEIFGERIKITDTHHFVYANIDHKEKGWDFKPDAEWASEREKISAEIYWGSVNPWAN